MDKTCQHRNAIMFELRPLVGLLLGLLISNFLLFALRHMASLHKQLNFTKNLVVAKKESRRNAQVLGSGLYAPDQSAALIVITVVMPHKESYVTHLVTDSVPLLVRKHCGRCLCQGFTSGLLDMILAAYFILFSSSQVLCPRFADKPLRVYAMARGSFRGLLKWLGCRLAKAFDAFSW
jgi:hypothetical protein